MIDSLPAVIAAYVAKRAARIELDHQVESMKKEESELRDQITNLLTTAGLTTGGGGKYRATLVPKDKPVTEDWKMLYEYIKEHNAFDLIQRRLTETAVKARWEEGEHIPGIVKFPVIDLSITKV